MTTKDRIEAVRKAFPKVKQLCEAHNTACEEIVKALLGDKYQANGLNLYSFGQMAKFEKTITRL